MYEELVKRLKIAADLAGKGFCITPSLCLEAANAIEELEKVLNAVNNAHNEGYDVGYWAGRRDYECKWIPVTERLPKGADKSGELCEKVWLFFDDGNVYPGWMNGITEKVYYLDNYSGSLMTAPISRVKMWQPRPEPPKEE